MAKISGSEGALTFDSGAVKITSFSITIDAPIFDSTDSSSSGWREKTATGWKNWTGTFEGFLEGSVAAETLGGTAAEAVFTAATGITFTGNIILTQKVVTVPIAEGTGTTIAYNFEGTGALTEANP